jgi:hypothetical protein
MKKLFAILLVMVLTSCVTALEPPKSNTALEPPKSNTDYKNIIGKPIRIGNIEVAQYDFPSDMNLEDAKKACKALGEGWRLPYKDELNLLYQNKVAIGGFANKFYWSSTENVDNLAWIQYFYSGAQDYVNKYATLYVRAIRAFTI